jgi:hypothetical protein
MPRRSSLLLLVGCNQILGLPEVAQRDAAFYDAHVDAPSACPTGEPPRFDHGSLVQILNQDCSGLTISDAGTVLAMCHGVAAGIYEGVLGAPLSAAPGFETTSTASFSEAHIAPEGDIATARRVTSSGDEAVLLHRDASGWVVTASLSPLMIGDVSQPSRGPNARVLVVTGTAVHELVDTGTTWEDRNTYAFAQFTSEMIDLAPDGLHMWWAAGTKGLLWADRPTLDDPFVERGPIPGTEMFNDGFITPDCNKIYFSTLQRAWVAPRAP